MGTATNTVLGAALAAALVAGCSSGVGRAGTRHIGVTTRHADLDVHGSVELTKRYESTWGRKHPLCWAKGNDPFSTRADGVLHTPYDDVEEGASVFVTDALGNTLGVAELSAGHAPDGQHCAFGFDLMVPAVARSYRVAVAGHPAQEFSAAQLRHAVTVSLGW